MDKQSEKHTKYRRTSSWQSQPEFDTLLGDIQISGLQFLVYRYERDLTNYRVTHNLKHGEYFRVYKEKQQRLKMVNDELGHRINDIWASPSYYGEMRSEYDSTTGIVWDKDGIPLYTLDFNESETGYIMRNLEGEILDTWEIEDRKIPELTKEDIYSGWSYWIDA